uniref:3-beta hydroxysteroid dehydrogenase/isomerase domain-containing protein n=1 Tax=Oncorhynchus tshawytscha TaxID=74940 RepID=A0A8C8CUB0_ONCTS
DVVLTFKSLQTVFLGWFGAILGRYWLNKMSLPALPLLSLPASRTCLTSQVRGDIVVSVFEGDIRDSELLRTACKGASEVYHTASLIDTYVQESMESFIYTSSIEVAGPNANGDPIINGDENTPYTCSIKFSLLDGIPNRDVLYRTSHPEAQVNHVYAGNTALAHLQAARPIRGNFSYISDDTPPISYFDFNRVVLSPLGFRYPPINRQLLNMLNMPFSFTYRTSQRDMGYVPRYSWEEVRKWTMDWLASQLPKERK